MLVNKRTGKIVAERVEVAKTFWKRATGLMLKRKYDGALVFPNVGREAFHGFFCRFPILIVCLDQNNRVTDLKILNPWSVVAVNCRTAIELDARRAWDIKKGDELVWDEN